MYATERVIQQSGVTSLNKTHMIDRLDIDAYVIEGVIHLIPNSASEDGSVVFEVPSEECRLNAPDEEIGASILRAAERCREGSDLGGATFDEVAKVLGFRSNAALNKKLIPFHISRRGGSDAITVRPMRREKSQLVFTEQRFVVSLNAVSDLGKRAKEAARISGT
jgi:hypothetical protein